MSLVSHALVRMVVISGRDQIEGNDIVVVAIGSTIGWR